ncbi:MAG TPA: CcmD family protein [Myxococcales bacterium]|nr:CcmD family protein [Myxococcales bacterium]
MDGTITGGIGYVIAAYGISWTFILLYLYSLVRRSHT